MRTRIDLDNKLRMILGSNNVYFRPPSKGMKYPCIKYELDGDTAFYADNLPYINPKRWQLIIIDENPDTVIPDKVKQLPYCKFDRTYQADGLNHFVFTLYF